ncbi:MAG: DUF4331 family protein [Gammaproteobacteria bacterium]
MIPKNGFWRAAVLISATTVAASGTGVRAADHNDPNVINSIFSDVPISAADLYDIFGFPADNTGREERVVIALTFAAVPKAGEFDKDMLYRVRLYPGPRPVHPQAEDQSLETMLGYVKDATEKYLHGHPAEIRVRAQADGRALVRFIGFPGGDFDKVLDFNRITPIALKDGKSLQLYLGGRDDAFFNDLPGFFRSINYAPQFYHVTRAETTLREMPIPKTLLELEDNPLFNYDPQHPLLGKSEKANLPPGPYEWRGKRFKKDANGNFRFAYTGKDAQAGKNVNAIIVEMPLSFITRAPSQERIVNTWGESWVAKASTKIPPTDDTAGSWFAGAWNWVKSWFTSASASDKELDSYRLIDTDGVPFADAGLNERADAAQLGADNELLGRNFVRRLGHLGWGFGPSITALGLGTCFDHGGSPVSVSKTYDLAVEAFPKAKKCVFQEVNMPDDSWRRNKSVTIPLKRPFEIFVPNVCAIDMDTNGTWPYGRRLEDQVANRFLSIFLDMKQGCKGQACNVETLSDQKLWDAAPIEPKTSPNPLHNDVPFLASFPYLAEPHTESYVR